MIKKLTKMMQESSDPLTTLVGFIVVWILGTPNPDQIVLQWLADKTPLQLAAYALILLFAWRAFKRKEIHVKYIVGDDSDPAK